MNARKVLWLLVAFIVIGGGYGIWKKHFSGRDITVAPVAKPRSTASSADAEHPPAWIAPDPATASAVAGEQMPKLIEPMPVTPEGQPQPVLMAQGQFRPVDSEDHDASGWVRLYRKADGSYLVRIEALWMMGAPPKLDVALVRVPRVQGASDLEGAIPLGALKAVAGNMNYPVQGEGAASAHGLALIVQGEQKPYATAALASPK